MNKRIHLRDWLVVVVGFVFGLCVTQVMIYRAGPAGKTLWDELFRRLAWAYHGGGGESADWGEPMVFLIFSAFGPSGVLAVLCGLLFLAADVFLRKRPTATNHPRR